MNFRDFKIGWRLLVKEPSYSAIVIFGLAIGVAVCFLLLGLVKHEYSYDQHVAENEKIYLIKENGRGASSNWNSGTSIPAAKALLNSGLPVMVTPFITKEIDVRYGERVQAINISFVEPDFRKIFNIKPLVGDLATAIKRPDSLAITQNTAIKLFGNLDVVGKTILVNGNTYTIAALLADPPLSTSLPYEAIAGIDNTAWPAGERKNVTENWGSIHGGVYVKLNENIKPDVITNTIVQAFEKSSFFNDFVKPSMLSNGETQSPYRFKLVALREQHLDPDLKGSATQDPVMLAGLAAIAIVILLLAATNYVNLVTVRALRRQREIALRKVLGASTSRVLQQFLSESVLVCSIATILGLALAWLLLPIFADLVALKLDDIFSVTSVSLFLLLGVLLGLLAGLYPAWSALKVLPTAALAGRGNNETAGGLRMRRILTVLQFTSAMALTGTSIAITWQTRFVSHLDPGLDPRPLLVVEAPDSLRQANARAFREAIVHLPGVTGVAVSNEKLTRNSNSDNIERSGHPTVLMRWLSVSPDFFEVHHLQAVAGRLYNSAIDKIDKKEIVLINASAVKKLGFNSNEEAVGQYLKQRNNLAQIIGVVPDIRHTNAKSPPQATFYFLSDMGSVYTIRTEGDKEQLQKAIENLWSRYFPNAVFRSYTMESDFGDRYADDMRIAKLLGAASLISIAIAAFGIYVLAAYSVQRRTREIVLRKLYGANASAIIQFVGREFVLLVGLGALVGLPLAYYASAKYLASFVEHAPIGIWALCAALAVAALVALLSTLRHTLTALSIMPVQALRD